jgi:hypothetical protein
MGNFGAMSFGGIDLSRNGLYLWENFHSVAFLRQGWYSENDTFCSKIERCGMKCNSCFVAVMTWGAGCRFAVKISDRLLHPQQVPEIKA